MNKCRFHVDTVNFLRFMVNPKGVFMEENQVQSIKDWPEPTCVRDIQVFLGFANFYRRFIQGYSRITTPLTEMTHGSTRPKQRTAKFARHLPAKLAPWPEKTADYWASPSAMEIVEFSLTQEAKEAFEKLKKLLSLPHYWQTRQAVNLIMPMKLAGSQPCYPHCLKSSNKGCFGQKQKASTPTAAEDQARSHLGAWASNKSQVRHDPDTIG